MKKTIRTLIVCCLAVIAVSFTGCFTPLVNAPEYTANMKKHADSIVYDDYVYFANSFVKYTDLVGDANNPGKAENGAMYRVKTTNGKIEYDKDTSMPKNVELVLSKVVGSEHTFMYSIDDYIYFASPNAHKDKSQADRFELTTFFKVKTDGTGLKEIYTTESEVSQQNVLHIGDKHILIFVEGTALKKIELGVNTVKTLVDESTSIVFADKYVTENDKFAYYTTNLEENLTNQNLSGTYLNKVDIISGDVVEKINKDSHLNKSITLDSVVNGSVYFKMNADNGFNYYYKYESGAFSTLQQISAAVDTLTVNDFMPVVVTSGTNQSQTTYYIFAISTSNVNKTYIFKGLNKDFSEENLLFDSEVKLLFADGEFVYFAETGKGIYRISVIDKAEQTIMQHTDFLTTNIAFDGKYLYFYAKNADNTTGKYYQYRASIRSAEIDNEQEIELLGFLDDEDMPSEEE